MATETATDKPVTKTQRLDDLEARLKLLEFDPFSVGAEDVVNAKVGSVRGELLSKTDSVRRKADDIKAQSVERDAELAGRITALEEKLDTFINSVRELFGEPDSKELATGGCISLMDRFAGIEATANVTGEAVQNVRASLKSHLDAHAQPKWKFWAR